MADEQLNTNINITAQESASGPMEKLGAVATTTVGSLAHLQAAIQDVSSATAAGASSINAYQGSLQQASAAAQRTATQLQQVGRALQQSQNSIQQAVSGSGGGFVQQMQGGLQRLTQEAGNVGRTFQGLGSSLQAPFHMLGGALGTAQSSIQGLGNSLTSALGPILQGAGFALAIAGVNGLSGAFQAVADTALGFNSKLQLAQISFQSFTGDAKLASQEIKALQVLAATSPFEFEDVLVGARRFQTLGLSAGQTITLLKDLSAISGSFGLDTAQFGRAELAIQQVGVKGRLTGEELRQMGNDGFNALRIIQITTGQSMSSIQKDIEAGTFSASKFFAILHEYAQRPDIQLLAKNIEGSFAVATSNVHDLFQQLTSTATKPFFDSVTVGINGFAAALQTPAIQQFAADVGATLQELLGKFQPLEPAFHKVFDMLQSGDIGGAATLAFQTVGQAADILVKQMFGAGQNVAGEFAGGLIDGAASLIRQAADFAAGIVASFLVGNSPPAQGPLQGVDQGGKAVADAWIGGFQSADFAGAASGEAAAVKNALGQITGVLDISSGRSALQAAGQDMERLRAVAEAAGGATRTINDGLRDNQRESQSLARDVDRIKEGFDAQLEPLERSLQALRDQGDAANQLYDIEKRRRDLTFSAQEKLLQGDPIKRAELQNADQALQQQERGLRLQEQKIRLDSAGATGKGADQAKADEARIAQQINEIEYRRATIQQQIDGLVDREGLARLNVAKAQADQADAAHDLQKAQDDYTKSLQEDALTKQIHDIKNAQTDALKPLEDRKKILDAERQSLQEEAQIFAQLKSDASEMLIISRQQEAERKAAVTQAKKDAKEHGADDPIGKGIPEADVNGMAAQAGEKIGASMLGGMQKKIGEIGPQILGGAIGAAAGGAVLGPIGFVAGGIFGAEFAKALQEKVPDLPTTLGDSLTTFKQALQGDWSAPELGEDGAAQVWINPFVLNVGKAGTAIHEFATKFSEEWGKIDGDGTVRETVKSLGTTLQDLGKALLYSGQSSDTASPQISAAGQAGKTLADGFKGAAQFVKEVSDAVDALAKVIQPVVDALNFLNNLNRQHAADARANKNPGASGPAVIGAAIAGQPIPKPLQGADLAQEALKDWHPYVEGVDEALQTLGPTIQEAIDGGTLPLQGVPAAVDAQTAATQQAATNVGTALQAPLTAAEAQAKADADLALAGIPQAVIDQHASMSSAATQLGSNLQTPIAASVDATITDADGRVPILASIVAGQNQTMNTAAAGLGAQLTNPMAQSVTATIDDTNKQLPGIPQAVADQHAEMYSQSSILGDQMHSGLNAGLDKGKAPTLQNFITWAGDILNGVKKALGIASPSTEFEAIGTASWEGLQSGFLSSLQHGENAILDTVRGLADKVKSVFGGMFSGGFPSLQGQGPDMARQAARAAGIDPEIFARQIQQESGFDPNASSASGARGIGQFMPGTASQAAQLLGVTTEEFWGSVELQLKGAAALMKQYLDQYGSYANALVAYNAGPGRVGGVLPSETVDYVQKILGMSQTGPQQAANAGGFSPITLRTTQAAGILDPNEAATRCGPYAAQLFAQAIGRNPTAQEADELARGFGWVPGQGMTSAARWPDMAQALINSKGGGAHIQQIGQAQAASAAQTGAPVAISTAQHYFVAQGYDPASQKFNVGATGSFLKGGSEWMSLDEMSRLGGGIIQVFTEIKDGATAASTATTTLGQASRAANAGLETVGATGQQFVTVLDGIYNNVANGRETLDVLQTQLIGIASSAGQEGAAGELMAMANGQQTAAQGLQNMATVAARTNPAIAALVKNYEALGGAANASQDDTAKFALDLLNVYKAAQGQAITVGDTIGKTAAGMVSGVSGAMRGSTVAGPLASINQQVDIGNQTVPTLTKNWTDAAAAETAYGAVDLLAARVEDQISKVDDLKGAWNNARDAVESYIEAAKKAQGLSVEGSHLEGAKEIRRTGLYQLHEGEEVLSKAQVRQAGQQQQSDAGQQVAMVGGGYVDRRTINFNAVDPTDMIETYTRTEQRLNRLRIRGR